MNTEKALLPGRSKGKEKTKSPSVKLVPKTRANNNAHVHLQPTRDTYTNKIYTNTYMHAFKIRRHKHNKPLVERKSEKIDIKI